MALVSQRVMFVLGSCIAKKKTLELGLKERRSEEFTGCSAVGIDIFIGLLV